MARYHAYYYYLVNPDDPWRVDITESTVEVPDNEDSDAEESDAYNAAYDAAFNETVTASPANGAAISLYTLASVTFRRNFAYAPQMITMATGDLPIPANLQQSARHRYDNVSMRSLTQYQIGTDQEISRLDVLFGSLSPRPEWGCIVPDIV